MVVRVLGPGENAKADSLGATVIEMPNETAVHIWRGHSNFKNDVYGCLQ